MITRASIPDKVKVELLNWLCGDIIEAIHDLDHATRHFTANKTKETFKQFWLLSLIHISEPTRRS